MKEPIEAVKEFHRVFRIGHAEAPTLIPEEDFYLRHRLMEEENKEYLEACRNGDLVEIADALGDKLYILCGTILKHGMQDKIMEVFREIQRSNMSKLDENGQPIFRADGKILKGPGFSPPNIEKILDGENSEISG